jgi:chaperone modulatory protein CbpM
MDIAAVTALFADLTQVELTTWVERGWVVPEDARSGLEFHEIDVARVRLIHDLRRGMDVGEEAMPLVLSLLDQVYELRSRLNGILGALASQPRDVQSAVLEALRLHGADP